MQIPFHDLETQYRWYTVEIQNAIQKVLQSGQFIMGPEVATFEENLQTYLDCKHVISCGNGTDALLLALMAINLKPGDEVITSPFSFISVAEMVRLLGAKPVFVDIESDTYHLDVEKVQEKITARTRAIVPVSLFGQPADMDAINSLASAFTQNQGKKIHVIEDAAQSFGAKYKTKCSGNLSDIACFSFFPTKPLGCYGDGGAITTNDDLIAEKLKSLRIHGQSRRYQHKYIGLNSRLDTLQAAILNVKLKHMDEEVSLRQKIASQYDQNLATIKDIVTPLVKPDRSSVFAQYSIRVPNRDAFIAHMLQHQIPTAVHYPRPLHLQECFIDLGHVHGDFPIAERVANEIVSLPMSAALTQAQLHKTIDAIQLFYDCRHEQANG